MSTVTYHVGDVFEVMATMPDDSVDLVLTSPPFLALRSYLPEDHPDKAKELGSEPTPAEFIDMLLRVTAECRRLLRPHGTIAIELGDTYAGSGGAGGDYLEDGLREGQNGFKQRQDRGWPLPKSLSLVPEAYRFALAYGINPHTGEQSPAGQWRARNVVRWVRPNPPVGALGDKFRPATSEMVVACVSKDRFFDLDAVREPSQGQPNYNSNGPKAEQREALGVDGNGRYAGRIDSNPAGAPPLDWWKISPSSYSGSHYAVWPPELCVKPVKAMSPEQVCGTCGEPRRRIVETLRTLKGEILPEDAPQYSATGQAQRTIRGGYEHLVETSGGGTFGRVVIGESWSDCGHNNYEPGTVLDPFAGTGTTLLVAHGHGRNAIGIDIDDRNAELARQRIGELFLEVVG